MLMIETLSLPLYNNNIDNNNIIMWMLLFVPSLSMIVTVDDEVPSDNDKQLGNNLIAILNVSLSSCILSSIMSILNDDDVDPAEMMTLKTVVLDME